jgi:hypothetical protein
MSTRSRMFMLVILAIATLLTACTGTPFSTDNGPASDGVPKPLHRIEASAEAIIDLAPAGSWDQVGEKLTTITTAWNVYQPQAAAAGASQIHEQALSSALDRLRTAAAAKDAAITRQAANDLGAAVLDLFALYNPSTPADIGRLDVLERQIALDAAANNFTAAAASFAKTKATWEHLKPSILSHNGKSVVEKFESSLAIQASSLQAQDIAALTSEVNVGLELVDELEKLY